MPDRSRQTVTAGQVVALAREYGIELNLRGLAQLCLAENMAQVEAALTIQAARDAMRQIMTSRHAVTVGK